MSDAIADFGATPLHAAADLVEPRPDGMERIRASIGDRDRDRASAFARVSAAFARARARRVVARGQHGARQVVPLAAGLLAVASCLLPAGDRARYAEEYRSEQWDLAQSGAGRLRQLRYALHQLLGALPLRFVLRSPRRRGAAP
jgi:hypothetical protein